MALNYTRSFASYMPNKFKIGFLLLFCGLYGNMFCQIKTIPQQVGWLGLKVQAQLANGFNVGIRSEERRYLFPDARHQRIWANFFASKKISPAWQVSAGLWIFEISVPQNPQERTGELKEIRPYFFVRYSHPLKHGSLAFRLQSEYRSFRGTDAPHHFKGEIVRQSIRERFKLTYTVPLDRQHRVILADELHLRVASTPRRFLFQQNRVIAQLERDWSPKLSTNLGYVFWFQPTGQPKEYYTRQIVTLRFKYSFPIKAN
jgi:hypothetical protein